MSILPPWSRAIPWVLALLMAAGLWGLSERSTKLGERADAARADAQRHQRTIEHRDQTIKELRDDAKLNDEILAERELRQRRIGQQLRSLEQALASARSTRPPADCMRQPIGPELHRLLQHPPDPSR